MNSNKLYIASLKIYNRMNWSEKFCDYIMEYKHLKFVLVKSNNMVKFVDVQTKQKYNCNSFDYILRDITPFNDIMSNTSKNISKRKALTLFDSFKRLEKENRARRSE